MRLLDGGIELLGLKGGGLRLERVLPIECVFTNTLEVDGIVWSETSEVISEASV